MQITSVSSLSTLVIVACAASVSAAPTPFNGDPRSNGNMPHGFGGRANTQQMPGMGMGMGSGMHGMGMGMGGGFPFGNMQHGGGPMYW
jgi:hypothetical protein